MILVQFQDTPHPRSGCQLGGSVWVACWQRVGRGASPIGANLSSGPVNFMGVLLANSENAHRVIKRLRLKLALMGASPLQTSSPAGSFVPFLDISGGAKAGRSHPRARSWRPSGVLPANHTPPSCVPPATFSLPYGVPTAPIALHSHRGPVSLEVAEIGWFRGGEPTLLPTEPACWPSASPFYGACFPRPSSLASATIGA